ncbi:MAG: hypothetical protein EXR97_05935 [Nitrospiraceae bacterium]|nr:hypothetical protein [Nitrospiraceae bacterium]MSR24352.1 hypothetical protein [Nitrospiraceae bacterium]
MTDTRNEQDTDAGTAEALRQKRVRRFSVLITLALIVLCNAIILLSIWASGITLDSLFHAPDRFNPGRDECVRHNWHKVSGVQQPVRLCYEWINLSDPTGNTHTFQEDTDIVLGADGKLHYEQGGWVDARLFVLLAFAGTVLALGMALSKFLIARYRLRLEAMSRTKPL